MPHCHICDKLIQREAERQVVKGFDAEGIGEEEFDLCAKCAISFNSALKKCKTKKQREKFIVNFLKKVSEA